jgi:hypothetical protein
LGVSLVFDLLFAVVDVLPATVPLAVVTLLFGGWRGYGVRAGTPRDPEHPRDGGERGVEGHEPRDATHRELPAGDGDGLTAPTPAGR